MPSILAISGSTRAKSYNTMLLRACIAAAPKSLTVEVGSIEGIGLYNADEEAASGIPPAVAALKDRIAASAGLLIASPEYNNGVPGVLKNAIDWLSRPASDLARVFGELPVGIVGATPGRGGTILAQNAWLPIMRTLGALQFAGARVNVSGASSVFNEQGELADAAVRGVVEKYMAGFAAFVERYGRR